MCPPCPPPPSYAYGYNRTADNPLSLLLTQMPYRQTCRSCKLPHISHSYILIHIRRKDNEITWRLTDALECVTFIVRSGWDKKEEIIKVYRIWFGSFCERGAVGGVSSDSTALLQQILVIHKKVRPALFWDVTQCMVAITYRRFGSTHRSHLRRSRYPATLRNIPEERRPESTYNKGCYDVCGMVLPVTTQWLLCIPPALSVMKSECFPQNLFTDDSTNSDYFPIQH